MKKNQQNNSIIIYQANDGLTRIDIQMDGDTVWVSQAQIAELFRVTSQNITIHLKNIFSDGELDENRTCKDFLQVQREGNRKVRRKIKMYNLDVVISVGYRINSKIATKFRIWATKRLKEYLIKGFTMNDDFLKESGGGKYWYELLDRIRDIRSSEKVLYRQVLDLYATSVDYDPKSSESIKFFKIVQNKLHYAVHGNTASEIIFARVSAGKPFMGLLSFSGSNINKKDIAIAKNYLNEKELKVLNNIVSAFFDLAEVKAMDHKPLYMKDWITQLDGLIGIFNKKVLMDAGKVSHEKAMKKAEKEYKKYQVKTLSPVEKSYLETIKNLQKKMENKIDKK